MCFGNQVTDHAGIATEIVVEKQLIKEKKISKKQIGRDKFLKKFGNGKRFQVIK